MRISRIHETPEERRERKLAYQKQWREKNSQYLKEQARLAYIRLWESQNPGKTYVKTVPLNVRLNLTPEQRAERDRVKKLEYAKAYYKKNHVPKRPVLTEEERKQKARAAKRGQKRRYEEKYPEKVAERKRRAYLRNKEKYLALSAKWRKDNPERMKALRKNWEKSPNGRAHGHNRQAKRRQLLKSDNPPTTKEIRTLLESAKVCHYCRKPFNKRRKPTVDHIVPLAKNGLHVPSNLTAACLICNSTKCAKLPDQFAKEIGLLFL